MIKKQLVRKTAKATGYNQEDIESVLNTLIDVIRLELKAGGNVNINQFGKFYIKQYPERVITTPNGNTVKCSASKVPTFKAGKYFKDYCNDRLS